MLSGAKETMVLTYSEVLGQRSHLWVLKGENRAAVVCFSTRCSLWHDNRLCCLTGERLSEFLAKAMCRRVAETWEEAVVANGAHGSWRR
jgi:hypothetical protein